MEPLGPTLRRRRRREHPAWRALLAIVISVVLNLLIVTQLDASWLGVGKVAERREVSIAPLNAADWEANRNVGARPPPPGMRPRPPAAAEPPPPPRPPNQMPGQVVDLGDQPASQKPPPKETRFVSEQNRTVDKETRARLTKAPGQKTTSTPSGPVSLLEPGEQGTSEKTAPGAKGAKAPRADQPPAPTPTEKTEVGTTAPGERPAPRPEASPAPDAGGEGGEQRRGDPRLAISAKTLARLAGGAAPDHLQGLEEGDGTFLNTREWKYASYFNRIKEAISTTWDPRSALDKRDPDRSIYAFKDRYTLLSVTLDERGGLKDVAVAKTSTVDFLDRSAMDAFRKAQPFTNPPPGLVDGSGEIHFSFGFYLEVGRAGFRVFRGSSTP